MLYDLFFLTWSHIWIFSYFFSLTYIVLLFSILLYMLPVFSTSTSSRCKFSLNTSFYIISGSEVLYFLLLPIFCLLILNFFWSSSSLSLWFGHLVFTSFQYKFSYLILLFFTFILLMISSLTYFSALEIYDFFITKYNFMYWILLIFMTNSFFTVIFIIEVLSTLVFLLLTTSTFSSTFFYKNTNFDSRFFLQSLMPYTFLNSIIFLFWVSLLSSLNLFVFLIYVATSLMTFDWFLLEHVFLYIISTTTFSEIFTIGLMWFFLIFSIFLKCGIAPLFFWKPAFFKGIPMVSIMFYIIFFYFFLFIFLIYFLIIYLHELFYYYSIILFTFVISGLIMLLSIICESFYLKTFFAVSSILNSLLVLLAMLPSHNFYSYIYL